MADLVLSDSLVDEYLKYKFGEEFHQETIRKLFKYIQPFFIKDSHRLMQDPAMPMQLSNDPMIEIVNNIDDEELVQQSLLKLMLVDTFTTTSFTTVNISGLNEKIKPRFGGMYSNQMDKNKAQIHIKALLSNAQWVKISDSYINMNTSQWDENKNIIKNIILHSNIDLTIESGSVRSQQASISEIQKSELNDICTEWNIKANQYNDNIKHDRYIETDKLKILLSSGLYNLSTTSNKDFTYIIELKI